MRKQDGAWRTQRGLRIREGMWHYRFKVNRHEYTGNTGLAATRQNVNEALRIRSEERKKILSGGAAQTEIYPFNKAAEQFLAWCDGEYRAHPNSAGRIRTSFASLVLFFKNQPVLNIREGQIEDYKTWRRALRIKEITLRHDLHALSVFFRYAEKQGWCSGNPVEKVEIPSDEEAVRMYVLNEEEESRYFQHAKAISDDLYDVMRIMILQGCRPEEVMSLEQSAVSLSRGEFTITKGKSKAARRIITMVTEVIDIMSRRIRQHGRWVFPSTRKKGRHITKLNNAHNEACARAGLDIVPYDMRHTFATRMALDGCSLPTLMAILGHSNLRSIMKYVHPSADDLREAMRRYGRGQSPSPLAVHSASPCSADEEGRRRTTRDS